MGSEGSGRSRKMSSVLYKGQVERQLLGDNNNNANRKVAPRNPEIAALSLVSERQSARSLGGSIHPVSLGSPARFRVCSVTGRSFEGELKSMGPRI